MSSSFFKKGIISDFLENDQRDVSRFSQAHVSISPIALILSERLLHLSNDACAEMIRDMIDQGTYNFILGHLSENNNTHEKAYLTVTEYLRRFKLEQSVNYNIAVANRYEPTKGIEI